MTDIIIARSKSALSRILRRLTDAIMKLLHATSVQDAVTDYGSLMSLSNSSRVDAIKAMNSLSSRLSRPSSHFQEERRPRSLASAHSSRSHGQKSSKHGTSGAGSQAPATKSADTASCKPRNPSKLMGQETPRRNGPSKHRPKRNRTLGIGASKSVSVNQGLDTVVPSRVSLVSMSSDSTKLGEIPQRRSHLVKRPGESTGSDCRARPIYPIQPYQPPMREKRGLLRRMFGTGKGD